MAPDRAQARRLNPNFQDSFGNLTALFALKAVSLRATTFSQFYALLTRRSFQLFSPPPQSFWIQGSVARICPIAYHLFRITHSLLLRNNASVLIVKDLCGFHPPTIAKSHRCCVCLENSALQRLAKNIMSVLRSSKRHSANPP